MVLDGLVQRRGEDRVNCRHFAEANLAFLPNSRSKWAKVSAASPAHSAALTRVRHSRGGDSEASRERDEVERTAETHLFLPGEHRAPSPSTRTLLSTVPRCDRPATSRIETPTATNAMFSPKAIYAKCSSSARPAGSKSQNSAPSSSPNSSASFPAGSSLLRHPFPQTDPLRIDGERSEYARIKSIRSISPTRPICT